MGNALSMAYKAGEDFSTLTAGTEFRVVKFDAATLSVVKSSAAGDLHKGIIQNVPESGDPAEVVTAGYAHGTAGAAFAAAVELTSDANGKLVAAVATNRVIAFAEQAASGDGALVQVQVVPAYVKA